MGRVAFDQVTKRFDGVTAVDELSLRIEDEELLVLLGPSGCGKTTALRMLAGLEDPSDGRIVIGHQIVNDVAAVDRDVAMVFQSYALYPHMTVERNVEFPLRTRRMARSERQRRVSEAAEILGLQELLGRKPGQLSGGQRQRVALARAIVREPEVFLMDEPLSNLDAKLRAQTRGELVELQRRLATTTVYVTHDQVEAMTMGHRIAILNQGVLQQVGPPQEVYARPANLFVARFIGNPPMNTLPGTVVSTTDGLAVEIAGGQVPLPAASEAALRRPSGDTGATEGAGAASVGEVVLGARSEHMRLDPDGQIEATVAVVEALGHEQHVLCRVADGTILIVRQPGHAPSVHMGEAVRIAVDVDQLHVFDATSEARVEAEDG